jgi:hypothetical protein
LQTDSQLFHRVFAHQGELYPIIFNQISVFVVQNDPPLFHSAAQFFGIKLLPVEGDRPDIIRLLRADGSAEPVFMQPVLYA